MSNLYNTMNMKNKFGKTLVLAATAFIFFTAFTDQA